MPIDTLISAMLEGLEEYRKQEASVLAAKRAEQIRQARIAAIQAAREKAWVVYQDGIIQAALLVRPHNNHAQHEFIDQWGTKEQRDKGFWLIRVYIDHPEGIPCACGQRIDGFQSV